MRQHKQLSMDMHLPTAETDTAPLVLHAQDLYFYNPKQQDLHPHLLYSSQAQGIASPMYVYLLNSGFHTHSLVFHLL